MIFFRFYLKILSCTPFFGKSGLNLFWLLWGGAFPNYLRYRYLCRIRLFCVEWNYDEPNVLSNGLSCEMVAPFEDIIFETDLTFLIGSYKILSIYLSYFFWPELNLESYRVVNTLFSRLARLWASLNFGDKLSLSLSWRLGMEILSSINFLPLVSSSSLKDRFFSLMSLCLSRSLFLICPYLDSRSILA